MRNLYTVIFVFAFVGGMGSHARLSETRPALSTDQLLEAYLTKKEDAAITMKYFGLQFSIDEKTTTCQTMHDGKLICVAQTGAQIIFERHNVESEAALKLLRYRRQGEWFLKYRKLMHYTEGTVKVMNQSIFLQQARFFRLDNINWPVLIRAFDVVMTGKTVISVSTICDEALWPTNSELVGKIERSIAQSNK